MKIAYLITAYNNPLHLNRLLKSLEHKDSYFFIHIDKKSNYKFNIPKHSNIIILKNNINVYWGSFSFIEAIIKLVALARSVGTFHYYVLLSGTDYPVRSNDYIRKFLKSNSSKEYINLSIMPANGKPMHRVEYFYIQTNYDFKLGSILKRIVNRCIRIFKLKRKLPSQYSNYNLYGGSNWWALSDKCIEYVLDFINKNPKFIKFYKNTLIPEEMFFQTIIGNSSFMNNVNNSFTYADWSISTSAHPQEISKKHIPIFKKGFFTSAYGNRKTPILFARKFSDNSEELINIIDKEIRK